MSKEKPLLFKFLESINYTKDDFLDEFNEKEYKPYMINHFLSGNLDSVIHANEMNIRSHASKQMQFDYLMHSLRKRPRYAKWLKDPECKDMKAVMEYYGYSKEKAKEAVKLLSAEELEYIHRKTFKGGTKSKTLKH